MFVECVFEHFIDQPLSLPPGAVADPLGGPGWWVQGDTAHLIAWLGAGDTVGPDTRRVQVGFDYEVRRLTRQSRLLLVKCVASPDGDSDLRIVGTFKIARLVVAGADAAWHARLVRRVQEHCQQPQEWLPVAISSLESYVIQTTEVLDK